MNSKLLSEFISFAKEAHDASITAEPTDTPDTFASIFGIHICNNGDVNMLNFKNVLKLESGLYTADVDGKPAVITRDVGRGFTVRTESKPGWYQVKYYDENGLYEGLTYHKDTP